jgi:membrane protease YdiL (CAAX protease family)
MKNTETYFFRNFWGDRISFNPLTGVIFFILFMIGRYLLVINATVTGSSKWLPFIFILMIIIPVLLLNKNGRARIGLKKPRTVIWLLYGFAAGITACLLIYLINVLLFQNSPENALVYISRSYDSTKSMINEANKTTYFIIYAVIAMTVSPLGEEIFFRGFIHEHFASKWGENQASDADSVAFSITHLIHFGIVYISGHWTVYFASAIVWLASMYVVSKLFFYCRQQSGSVYGAVAAHSGFNLAMTWLIFYHI